MGRCCSIAWIVSGDDNFVYIQLDLIRDVNVQIHTLIVYDLNHIMDDILEHCRDQHLEVILGQYMMVVQE